MDLVSLIPSFGGLVWTVLAFVVALSVIVAVHEYGHYIVGRWSGIHAEVFSLGFGPVIWSRMDRRGTRWQIAVLPFGGFVKFLGDADAASGKDAAGMAGLSAAERRHTMHGAPLWARSATVLAGPVFNFILAILIFTGFLLVQGVATELPVVGSVKTMPNSAQTLLPGDQILALGGTETPDLARFVEVTEGLTPAPTIEYRVLRDGAEVTFAGPFPMPPRVEAVQPGSAAMESGMLAGDVVQSVDGRAIHAFSELRQIIGASDGQAVDLGVWRADGPVAVSLTPRRVDLPNADGGFETNWLIGLHGGLVFAPETRVPGPLEALGLGVQQTWTYTKMNVSGIWHIVAGKISSCNLSGPIGIAEVAGSAARQGWEAFLHTIALLSLGIGILNLFPVPVLDGGHLVFHAWEAATGRPPSDRALRVMMTGGLAALLTLMIFALSNDLILCP